MIKTRYIFLAWGKPVMQGFIGLWLVFMPSCTRSSPNEQFRDVSSYEASDEVLASESAEEGEEPVEEYVPQPDEPQMTSYLPANLEVDVLSEQVHGYSRELVEDEWNSDAVLYERAFELLTPTGRLVFEASRDYVEDQKGAEFHEYAQPLQSAANVSYVLSQVGYEFRDEAISSIPHMIDGIESIGGRVYDVPRFDAVEDNTAEIIAYFNKHFPQSIPAGALLAGCLMEDCTGSELSGGHIGIVGDKNEFGEVMVYHNNWYRPNSEYGVRVPYMISLENLYVFLRPREWMATPWLKLDRNSDGKLVGLKSASAPIADFHIFGGDYHVKLILLPSIAQELDMASFLPVHGNISSGNVHRYTQTEEASWTVCRTKEPLRTIEPRTAPSGLVNYGVINTLKTYAAGKTILDYSFEFAIVEEQEEWISALVYDQGRYWGSDDYLGSLWLHRSKVDCFQKQDLMKTVHVNGLGLGS